MGRSLREMTASSIRLLRQSGGLDRIRLIDQPLHASGVNDLFIPDHNAIAFAEMCDVQ